MTPAREPIKVVGDVLAAEMALIPGQIMLGLENWRIPPTRGLYVALLYGTERVVGSVNRTACAGSAFLEYQEVAMLHDVTVEVMSFDSSARLRRVEVLQALRSVAAQNAADAANMKISGIPENFLPIPSPEPAKQLNRFHASFRVNALYQKVRRADYYATFSTPEVLTNG